MTDIIGDSLRTSIDGVFDDIHDSFKKTVTYWKKVRKTSSVFSDDTYNPLYKKTPAKGHVGEQELESGTISARIKFVDKQLEELIGDPRITVSKGSVRLKITTADHETLKKAQRIEMDNEEFILTSDAKTIGPFSRNYVMVYLSRA